MEEIDKTLPPKKRERRGRPRKYKEDDQDYVSNIDPPKKTKKKKKTYKAKKKKYKTEPLQIVKSKPLTHQEKVSIFDSFNARRVESDGSEDDEPSPSKKAKTNCFELNSDAMKFLEKQRPLTFGENGTRIIPWGTLSALSEHKEIVPFSLGTTKIKGTFTFPITTPQNSPVPNHLEFVDEFQVQRPVDFNSLQKKLTHDQLKNELQRYSRVFRCTDSDDGKTVEFFVKGSGKLETVHIPNDSLHLLHQFNVRHEPAVPNELGAWVPLTLQDVYGQ